MVTGTATGTLAGALAGTLAGALAGTLGAAGGVAGGTATAGGSGTAYTAAERASAAVTSPRSGASRRRSDLSTLAYSSSTGDSSDRSLSELHGSTRF